MVAQKKPGRPRSPEWVETAIAAEELGLSHRQLRSLLPQLKAGHHYRVKNPKAAKRRYLWNPKRIEVVLIPEKVNHGTSV